MDLTALFSLEGRVALVTGGSRGIGRMITEGLLAQGATVYITARKEEACRATAADLSQQYGEGRCVALPSDVSTTAGIGALLGRMGKSASVIAPRRSRPAMSRTGSWRRSAMSCARRSTPSSASPTC